MFRSRALREGSLGLFALSGLLLFGAITIWLRGGGWGQRSYQILLDFPDVEGLQIGAPVRFRGVRVGTIRAFNPSSNNVEVVAEISSTDLRIPSQVTVQTTRQGLIGEAAVEITPSRELTDAEKKIDPLSDNCNKQVILCNNSRLEGRAGAQLATSFNRLVETYTDPEFVGNLNDVTRSAADTARRISKLSDSAAVSLQTAQNDLARLTGELSRTSRSVNRAADNASRFVNNLDSTLGENRQRVTTTIERSARLVDNLDSLLQENRSRISTTIDNVNRASVGIQTVAANLNATSVRFNESLDGIDTRKVMANLETVIANAVETSNNLREITKTLNDPQTIVTLQKTLESARVTFENTRKITSDVDELLGDPQFRQNLRRLVDGLSDLVSSTEQLEYRMRLARALDAANRELADRRVPVRDYHLDPSKMGLYPIEVVRKAEPERTEK